jgi:hypothetical protein
MLCKANELVCHCEKMQASLRASIFEAILPSVTAEAWINFSLDILCMIASLHSFKIFPLALQNFSLVSLAMTAVFYYLRKISYKLPILLLYS